MIDKKIENWIYKFNLDHKIFYSNFSVPKIKYTIKNYILTSIIPIEINKNIIINDFKISSELFFKETSLLKWDYILQNYFNHFNINKFSKILLINTSKQNNKNKIKHFYNVDNFVVSPNMKITLSKHKIYDLISIFPYDYKIPNSKRKLNQIIFQILQILTNILHLVNKDTIIHFHYIHYISANSLDCICLLENFFDVTFFSEYKLQDIDKTSIDIILSNARNLDKLQNDLIQVLNIFNFKYNNIGFLQYDYIPKRSSIFIYKHLCNFLNKRHVEFMNLKINKKKFEEIYKRIIMNQVFTQDVQNTHIIQIPLIVQSLNKSNGKHFNEGMILYNFILKNKINTIFQFGLFNGYISIFVLTALNKLTSIKKILLTIDSRQNEFYENKGKDLIEKLNISKYHIFIQDYVYNYIPKLISKNKKFKLIILHNVLIGNFQELMIEFYFALKILDKNGYIFLENSNFPKIKKMIHYIKNNLHFLSVFYENFYRNIVIFRLKDYTLLELYLSNNPIKEDKYIFKDF